MPSSSVKTGLLTSLTKGSTALHTTLQRRGFSLLGGILSYTGCRRVSWADLDASLPMYINTPDTNITPPTVSPRMRLGLLRDEPGAVGVYSTSHDGQVLHEAHAHSVLRCSNTMNIATLHASVKPTFFSASLSRSIKPKGAEDRRKDHDP